MKKIYIVSGIILAFIISYVVYVKTTEAERLLKKIYMAYQSSDFLNAYHNSKLFLTKFPKHEKAAEVSFISATISFGMNQIVRAIMEYEEVYKNYPSSPRAADSLYMLGVIYEEYVRDKKIAARYYQELVKKYPQTFIAKEAVKKLSKR